MSQSRQVLRTGAGAGALGASITAIRDILLPGGGASETPLRFAQEASLQLLLYAVAGALVGVVAISLVQFVSRSPGDEESSGLYVPGSILLILSGVAILLASSTLGGHQPTSLLFGLLACTLLAVGGVSLLSARAPHAKVGWLPAPAVTGVPLVRCSGEEDPSARLCLMWPTDSPAPAVALRSSVPRRVSCRGVSQSGAARRRSGARRSRSPSAPAPAGRRRG